MRNLKTLTLAFTLAASVAQMGRAADINVDAEAQFRAAITLAATQIDFTTGTNKIDFTGVPGVADVIQLGTNGTQTYTTAVFSGPATGTAGTVAITGLTGELVNISCTTTATIGDGVNAVTVSQVQISMNTGDAFGSADYNCAGMGTTPLTTYTLLAGLDTILIGGRIVGNSGTFTSGVYSTTTGGTPAQVRVVYQ